MKQFFLAWVFAASAGLSQGQPANLGFFHAGESYPLTKTFTVSGKANETNWRSTCGCLKLLSALPDGAGEHLEVVFAFSADKEGAVAGRLESDASQLNWRASVLAKPESYSDFSVSKLPADELSGSSFFDLIIDTRSTEEFAKRRLRGARNLPLEFIRQHPGLLRNDPKTLVYGYGINDIELLIWLQKHAPRVTLLQGGIRHIHDQAIVIAHFNAAPDPRHLTARDIEMIPPSHLRFVSIGAQDEGSQPDVGIFHFPVDEVRDLSELEPASRPVVVITRPQQERLAVRTPPHVFFVSISPRQLGSYFERHTRRYYAAQPVSSNQTYTYSSCRPCN